MYAFAQHRPADARGHVHLLGSGTILREVIAAAELLAKEWQVASDVWSVTSFSELARDARETERQNRLHPAAAPRTSYVAHSLSGDSPIVAATDYVAAYPQLIAPCLRNRFIALGTDGFGRSDTRSSLRRFFEVDRHHIVLAALDTLRPRIAAETMTAAIERYAIDAEARAPWRR
jgi:pyruvate dehydrogenase E1 component